MTASGPFHARATRVVRAPQATQGTRTTVDTPDTGPRRRTRVAGALVAVVAGAVIGSTVALTVEQTPPGRAPMFAARGAGRPEPVLPPRAPTRSAWQTLERGQLPAAPGPRLTTVRAPQAAPAFGWPVPPPIRVTTGFAPPDQPWLRGHRGVDLAVAGRSRVLAAGPGTVTFAGQVGGKPVIVVSHGPVRTTYEPVDPLVAAGNVVVRGQWLGTVAEGGGHCGVAAGCLHWGLIRGSTYLDPRLLLAPGRVVLKPPR